MTVYGWDCPPVAFSRNIFKSRWMTPFSCAADSPSAICWALASASLKREW